MDFSQIDKWIEEALPDMEQDLASLVKYNSVEAEAKEGAPFGPEVEKTLEEALSMCDRLGFTTVNADGYYGYADMEGSGEGMMGVLGHLDVVPAVPEDWNTDPFTLTDIDGKLYARGTIDDKGPMVAAIYGAKAVFAHNLPHTKTLRFIFGTNEETGMKGVEVYIEKEKLPDGGFTPDADWPIIVGEKGVCHFSLDADWADEDGECKLLELTSGTAANIVPAKAVAKIKTAAKLPEAEDISVSYEDGVATVTATGVATHGSIPMCGKNALARLIKYLAGLTFAPAGANAYIKKIAALAEDEIYGASMGLSSKDELSDTTVSLNMSSISCCGGKAVFDMRYILSDNKEHRQQMLEKLAADNGLKLNIFNLCNPLYLGENNPMVLGLLESYREVTGDMTEPEVIGGGTYAKVMPNFVAFGPEPSQGPMRAHEANEYITKDELVTAAKIYARGIYSMIK